MRKIRICQYPTNNFESIQSGRGGRKKRKLLNLATNIVPVVFSRTVLVPLYQKRQEFQYLSCIRSKSPLWFVQLRMYRITWQKLNLPSEIILITIANIYRDFPVMMCTALYVHYDAAAADLIELLPGAQLAVQVGGRHGSRELHAVQPAAPERITVNQKAII